MASLEVLQAEGQLLVKLGHYHTGPNQNCLSVKQFQGRAQSCSNSCGQLEKGANHKVGEDNNSVAQA